MRINKYLAHNNYCSRREADCLIEEGKVRVNGSLAKLGDQVTETDVVTVDNAEEQKSRVYYVYNKPLGVVTSNPHDYEEGIADILSLDDVYPVGRLDKDSTGLVVLTNDGRLTKHLLDPDKEVEKEYEVRVQEKLQSNFARAMESGIDIGDYVTKPCRVEVTGDSEFSIILTEGKNRQIRKMCNALRYTIKSLTRVRVATLHLGRLKIGEYRQIKGDELEDFLSELGLRS